MSTSRSTIDYALFCDDYRTEQNGKGLVVGLYGNKILFDSFPAAFGFCVCLIGRATRNFSFDFEVQFIPSDGTEPIVKSGSLGGALEVPSNSDPVTLFAPIKIGPIRLNTEGRLIVSIKSKRAKNWKKLNNVDVALKNPSATAPEQPS